MYYYNLWICETQSRVYFVWGYYPCHSVWYCDKKYSKREHGLENKKQHDKIK